MSKKYYNGTNESLYTTTEKNIEVYKEDFKIEEIKEKEEEKSEMKKIETKLYQLNESEINKIIKNHLLSKSLINEDDEVVISINKPLFSKKIKSVEVVTNKVTVIN